MVTVAGTEKKIFRCGIYTRKSTENGLESGFNSLDAQREAAENFIASQKMNGWQLLPEKYDDGGFSGSNTERPALKRLLADVEAGRIDIIVIYKLDRLSRSLLDFMKLIEFFEANNTSIVSVTQQINTSTSAGRMMLNVLMSFAQFERENIADRIRDRVAGAKRRGKFCGGSPVLGYDADPKTKKLGINKEEAELVKNIFKRYCESGSALEVVRELNKQGHKGKTWVTRKGKLHKGYEFNTHHIYGMLNNPLYIGKVVHKENTFPGEHEAIIDNRTWELTRALLDSNTRALSKKRSVMTYPLKGLVRCGYCGGAMTTSYTKKGNRRYIYLQCLKDSRRAEHSCPLRQVSGDDFEKIVLQQLSAVFRTPSLLANTYEAVRENESAEEERLLARRNELSAAIDSLRQKMYQSSETASLDELETLKKDFANADSELAEIKKHLKIFSGKPVSNVEIVEAFSNIDALWEELFPAEKHRLLQLIIEKITIWDYRMQMEIKTNGITSLVQELKAITTEERKQL